MPNKSLTLQEARAKKQLDRFIKDHPSVGDEDAFNDGLASMVSGKPKAKDRTSGEASDED